MKSATSVCNGAAVVATRDRVTAEQQARADAKAAADWERWWRDMSADERAAFLAQGIDPADAAPTYRDVKRRDAAIDYAAELIDRPPAPPLAALPFSNDLGACFAWVGSTRSPRLAGRRALAVIAQWFGASALVPGGDLHCVAALAGMRPEGWRSLLKSVPVAPRRKPAREKS